MRWESSGVVGFDLQPLLEGEMRTAKLKSAYNSLIIGPRGFGALSLRWIQFASVLRCARSSLFGVLRRFQHCTGHITRGSWKGRGNQYIQFVRVLYCKLPTNGKQLPAFPLEAVLGIEPRPQRWEARVLQLCHCGPAMGCVTKYLQKMRMGIFHITRIIAF